MSHLNPGLLSAYNSLTDKHLAGYFSNTRIRRHLQRAGLITRSGRIVPDKEYRHKLIQRTHHKHVRECLAQAIFHKVLEMERVHQIEIKRKLEEFARRDRVHKIKVERSKRYEEDVIHILSPRPPTGARCTRKQHSGPDGEHSESSESPGSSRPNTAPGKMQRPVRLKPIHSNSTTASLRRSSPYRLHESSNDNNQPFSCTVNKESRRHVNTMEASQGISPYVLPVINNFVTPVPPPTKRKERGFKLNPSGTLRGRRLRPTTASSGADITEDPPMLRSSVHQSRVLVNMMYFGKTVHLSHDLTDMRDEVKVFQQHCGGENLCVYKGKLCEGETFQFISRRHRGFPFSLTFFLNGLQVERLSSCCEFKHRKGSRLGGRHGHFGFCGVAGASPCYKCIIAMGLDKKPTPPPKRVREDRGREESVITLKEAPEMRAERTGSHSGSESRRARDMEVQDREDAAAEEEDKVRDDYEEDFEADDEGPAEDTEAKEKKSPSPRVEMERKVGEGDASETEDDQEKDEDLKSRSGSSSSCSDREDSDAEVTKNSEDEEKAEQPKEADEEETTVPPEKKDELQRGQTPPTEAESAAPKESDGPNSAGESTGINISSDTSVPSGNENKQRDGTSGEKESEKTVNESKQEEEQERAKSVQEKLAEAILKEFQCSSEPELSDTSTEDTIESVTKGQERDHKDAVAEKSVTATEQQQTVGEETKCDEGVVALAVLVLDQEQTSEQKEQEETEQEPDEREIKDERNDEVKSEEDKTTAVNDESEEARHLGAALLPVPVEKTVEEDKTSEAREDLADKPTVAAEKKEDSEETAVAEDYVHPQETGQGAKSSEGDESSPSAPDKKTDETAENDNAEAMTASKTVEMKAESSEEQEALSCEEAPVTRAAESKSEITEGSREPADEKTADTSQENAKDDSINDVNRESVSAEEASKDDNQQQEEEQPKNEQEEIDDKKEEKSEEEGKEEEKQTNADETTEGKDCEQRQMHGKDQTEEEKNNESRMEKNSNEEQAEKAHGEEDKVANVERADESEKTEKDEVCERAENQDDEESVKNIATTLIMTSAAEKISETIAAGDEEKQSVAEKAKREALENEAEQNQAANNEDNEESVRNKVVTHTTVEVEEKSEKAETPHKRADGDNNEDCVEKSEGKNESADVGDDEAANIALVTVMAATMEAEDVTKRTEGGGDNSDEGEIDAENGEISAGAENKREEDEAQIEGARGTATAEQTEEERNAEASKEDSTEAKEGCVESGDAAERNHAEEPAQAPVDAVPEVEANEEDDRVEKQDQSTSNESELEKSGTDRKEESASDERRDTEETKQDENGNLSESDHENRETSKSDNINEVIVAPMIDHAKSTSPTAMDSDDTALKLERSTALKLSDSNTEKQPNTEENVAATDLSAADGENGDTEEASKASEEGASVLLKPPPAESAQLSQQNEADGTEKSAEVVEETPEDLAREDLVTNWITMHQTSKFFETFVEPLEDLKELSQEADVSNSNKEGTQSTDLQRSGSPPEISENVELENTPKGMNESVDKTKQGAGKSDNESEHPEDGDPYEKGLAKDVTQEKKETEVHDFITKTDSGQIDKESVLGQDVRPEEHTERRGSVEEDKVNKVLTQDNTDQIHVSKTEVESITGANLSVTSGKPESIPEYQIDEETAAVLNDKLTAVEEEKDLPSSKTEEHGRLSPTPETFSKFRVTESEGTEETLGKSREVTEISDFTQSRSDDGSHEESHHEEVKPKPPHAAINGESRELQLIQDIKHTLSKDQLSTYSVDETLFPRSSYPLLGVASTESGH